MNMRNPNKNYPEMLTSINEQDLSNINPLQLPCFVGNTTVCAVPYLKGDCSGPGLKFQISYDNICTICDFLLQMLTT